MPLQRFNLTKAGSPTNGVNEMLTISMLIDTVQSLETWNTTSGTFTLTVGEGASAETTTALDFDATAEEVQAALIALDMFGTADLTCAGGPLNEAPVTITYSGNFSAAGLAGSAAPYLTPSVEGLEPAGTAAIACGLVAAPPEGGTFLLFCDNESSSALDFDISPGDLQTALEGFTAIGAGNVLCDGAAELFVEEQTIRFVNDLAGVDVPDITSDTSGLTFPGDAGTAALTITEDVKGVLGSYRGAPVGSTLMDTQNSKIYRNTGTAATPVWSLYPVVEV